MNIELKNNYYGIEVVVKGDESTIVFDVEHREWAKGEDGQYKRTKSDVDTGALDSLHGLMCDMIYYRKEAYDSSQLIKQLFEKLPESAKPIIIEELKNSF